MKGRCTAETAFGILSVLKMTCMEQQEILSKIKAAVREVIPDAKVYLFGSRARGDWHEESDWDILVLTDETVNRSLKKKVRHQIFPISLAINDFIDCTVVNHQNWNEHPGYYVLHRSVNDETVVI